LRNIHLNPTLPNAVPDFKLVDPMLGMFCKLASRHVITYTKNTPEDGQKLEKSGIIIELMRMRDFCFVLRDRARAALDVAMTGIGNPYGASEVSSSHEFMQYHANLAKMFISPSSNGNEKSRTDFVEDFETFTKPIEATNSHPAQAIPSLAHATLTDPVPLKTAAEVQTVSDPPLNEQNGHDSHINFETSMESIISHPVNDSQEFTVQEESGLWNWWDLIEMDIEGNTQMV